jgi:hypothetical protein
MRHLKRNLGFFVLTMGAAFAMPAAATQWTSDNATAATSPSACNTTIGSSTTSNACQMTITVGTQTLKVRAYSTRTADQTSGGLWRIAQIHEYTGGFGVTNVVSGDTGEGITPEHATDNNQVFDTLVFELPSSGFDLEAFRLGWASEQIGSGGTYTGEADLQAFFGGNNLGADYNFSNACFSNNVNSPCTASQNLTGIGGLGFTDITSLIANGGSNVPVNTTENIAGIQSGRYLVMAGALGGTNDNFKVNMIQATGLVPPQVPEPGTLALLALGLFGLVALKRRPVLA